MTLYDAVEVALRMVRAIRVEQDEQQRAEAADGRTVREVFWEERFGSLATYNSEVARGIVHTPEWIQKMADMQSDYNAKIQRRLD